MQESDVQLIIAVYKAAFAGFPWFEDLSISAVQLRWESYVSKAGFECFVFKTNDSLAGAIWWDLPSINHLRQERGDELANFYRDKFASRSLIWERDLIVSPSFQGQGIATQLRRYFIAYIESIHRSVVILTRMRNDNIGTIKIAEKLDFKRSGIRIPSSANPGIFHEYWYRLVNGGMEGMK
jgi:GNAT superfamily N-acetyltransferase